MTRALEAKYSSDAHFLQQHTALGHVHLFQLRYKYQLALKSAVDTDNPIAVH